MKTRTLLFLTLFIIMPALSYGQLGRLIRNTVTKAASKEANREIDSTAKAKADKIAKDNAANAQNENTEGNQTGGQSNQGGGQGMNFGGLFGGKVDLKYKEEYSFTSRLYMQTETYDKKEVMKMDLLMYFSANSPSVGIETKSITDEQGNSTPVVTSMVMDGENKCFLMLTDVNGSKMGIISPIPDENTAQTQQDGKPAQKSTPPSFTKTGGTKVIAGYKCDEYSYTNPENKTSGKVWFTKDANLNIDKRGWQKTGMGAYYGYAGFNEGIILANEAYDDKGKLTMKSETKEINPNFSHSIAVKGYSLRQMNLNQAPKK
jgi:hypothetical protein